LPRKNKPHLIKSRNPNVRQRFRDARLAMEKTQLAVATDLELKESYVRMIENNHTDPSLKKMIMFESYFGIPMEKLFSDLFSDEKRAVAK
jgi:transcriptional regulator with XRE-family HTH domain